VHRSNFAISGFTEQPRREELAQLARKRRLPLLEDLGSGALAPPGLAGLNAAMHEENSVAASVRAGASVVTYSGDKLLGGPQAGVLTGKKELIGRIRQNPLFRALRVDKLTYAALEATLAAYLREDFASIPTLRMMRLSAQKVGERAEAIARLLEPVNGLRVQIRRGTSMVGGGAAPAAKLPTFLLAIAREGMSAEQLAQALRRSSPPIVARIAGERVLLDLRTVLPEQEAAIVARLHELARP
jgi:L-seryl-tRNA(Ser) seleniumtransferase